MKLVPRQRYSVSLREREVQELVALSLARTLGIKRGGVLRAWGPALDIHGTLLPRGFVTVVRGTGYGAVGLYRIPMRKVLGSIPHESIADSQKTM